MLEYAQRLKQRQRCIAAAPPNHPSTGERLLSQSLRGGARAAGFPQWGFIVCARADLLVLGADEPALLGMPRECLLDALIFSVPLRPWRDVMVAGRWVIRDHRHPTADYEAFENVMQSLWN